MSRDKSLTFKMSRPEFTALGADDNTDDAYDFKLHSLM